MTEWLVLFLCLLLPPSVQLIRGIECTDESSRIDPQSLTRSRGWTAGLNRVNLLYDSEDRKDGIWLTLRSRFYASALVALSVPDEA